MDKSFIIILMIILISFCLTDGRIGFEILKINVDNSGLNWRYIHSNSTLIFDNLYITTSGFNLYFPFVLIEEYNIPNFTLILKNENTIRVNNVGDLTMANAFEFRGHFSDRFIIQGDGKLIIEFDSGKKDMYESIGFQVSNSVLIIKENAKIEIKMNNAEKLKGLFIFDASLYMENNSQLSVYIGKDKGSSTGISCNNAYLSGNVTINSSLLNTSSQNSFQWLSTYSFKLSNNSNVTFITNGTMGLEKSFFSYIGNDPIIINAIETLEEFKESHKLTQKNVKEPIIFSNYYTEKKIEKEDDSQFIEISFFILLNFILLLNY